MPFPGKWPAPRLHCYSCKLGECTKDSTHPGEIEYCSDPEDICTFVTLGTSTNHSEWSFGQTELWTNRGLDKQSF